MPYSIKNEIHTKALGDILQLRITETIRESEGGAYSPRAGASFLREPKSEATINIRFDCNPDLADKLAAIVNEEIQKMADGNIKDTDLNKIKTNFIKERLQFKDKNAYDMEMILSFFRYNLNINDPKNFEDIVHVMSKKDIQSLSKQIISEGDSYELIFEPKQ